MSTKAIFLLLISVVETVLLTKTAAAEDCLAGIAPYTISSEITSSPQRLRYLLNYLKNVPKSEAAYGAMYDAHQVGPFLNDHIDERRMGIVRPNDPNSELKSDSFSMQAQNQPGYELPFVKAVGCLLNGEQSRPAVRVNSPPQGDLAKAKKTEAQANAALAKKTKQIADQSSDDVLLDFTSAKKKQPGKTDDFGDEEVVALLTVADATKLWNKDGCNNDPSPKICGLLYKRTNDALNAETKSPTNNKAAADPSPTKTDQGYQIEQTWKENDCDHNLQLVVCKALAKFRKPEAAASTADAAAHPKTFGDGDGPGGKCADINPVTHEPCITPANGPATSDDGNFHYLHFQNSCSKIYIVDTTDDTGVGRSAGVGSGIATITCGRAGGGGCSGFESWSVRCSK